MVQVLKFGGASVATPESFGRIAEIVLAQEKRAGKVVVVVSAMGDTTDQLFSLAHQVNPQPPKRELDMLVSVGERVSIALLAMALAAKGREGVSFTGSQSGIITDATHSDARIVDVRPHRLMAALQKEKIVIVAGFQGVSLQGEITTLGRGGSDTTAVALAVALQSQSVVFYKDVAGIFDADPKKVSTAKKLPCLSYQEALSLCSEESAVLHPRSLSLAEKNGVRLSIRSFMNPWQEGTEIGEGSTPYYSSYEVKCLPNS
ncbi:MAG: aspartate kinase [Verrucomicrobiota bacterium]|nr:aspartate kinase [Verrucomicrobiota bacterium]